MNDAHEKTRHAVQMALAARSLASASADGHRKRVIARYVFVYLDDVLRFGPAWRNQLLAATRTEAAAESAVPALTRLRADWEQYENVRNFIAAKRQPRDPLDPVANEVESFKLWADIGALAVDTLVDDATELYAQLSSVTPMVPIELNPQIPRAVAGALADLDPVGEDGALAIAATSFGAARARTITLRMGGDVGSLVPMLNDVAENIKTLVAILGPASENDILLRLLKCQLPTELYELLRLALGPEPGGPATNTRSLLDLYNDPGAPPRPKLRMDEIQGYVDACVDRSELRDYRNRVGAHIDAETPWAVLEDGIKSMDLGPMSRVTEELLFQLELCAVEPGGPFPLLFPSHKLTSLVAPNPTDGVSYDDPDAEAAIANVPSALPPPGFDSGHALWVRGGGPYGSAAVAGMHAGRVAELTERVARRQSSDKG